MAYGPLQSPFIDLIDRRDRDVTAVTIRFYTGGNYRYLDRYLTGFSVNVSQHIWDISFVISLIVWKICDIFIGLSHSFQKDPIKPYIPLNFISIW